MRGRGGRSGLRSVRRAVPTISAASAVSSGTPRRNSARASCASAERGRSGVPGRSTYRRSSAATYLSAAPDRLPSGSVRQVEAKLSANCASLAGTWFMSCSRSAPMRSLYGRATLFVRASRLVRHASTAVAIAIPPRPLAVASRTPLALLVLAVDIAVLLAPGGQATPHSAVDLSSLAGPAHAENSAAPWAPPPRQRYPLAIRHAWRVRGSTTPSDGGRLMLSRP